MFLTFWYVVSLWKFVAFEDVLLVLPVYAILNNLVVIAFGGCCMWNLVQKVTWLVDRWYGLDCRRYESLVLMVAYCCVVFGRYYCGL